MAASEPRDAEGVKREPVALTSMRTLADPELEKAFCAADMYHSLLPSAVKMCVVMGALYLVVVLQQIFEGWPWWSISAILGTAALHFTVALLLHRALACQTPRLQPWMVQWLLVAVLNFCCLTGPLVFVPSRLPVLGITSLSQPPSEYATGPTDYALKIACSLVASACFCPCDLVPLAVHYATMIGWFAVLEALNGLTRHAQVIEIALLVSVGLMALYFRAEMRGAERVAAQHRLKASGMIRLMREADARELTHRLEAKSAGELTTARSRLIRVVMHDLRSPLLTITNAAQYLRSELGSAGQALPAHTLEPTMSCADALVTCSNICNNIIRDMLDFERIDSGRLQIIDAPFTVDELLRATRHAFDPFSQTHGVQLHVLDPPDELRAARWLGDVHRVQQCVHNAMSNAIKFTPQGKSVTVRVFTTDPPLGAPPAAVIGESAEGGEPHTLTAALAPTSKPASRKGSSSFLADLSDGSGRVARPSASEDETDDVLTAVCARQARRRRTASVRTSASMSSVGESEEPLASSALPAAKSNVAKRFAFGVEVVDEGCGLSADELKVLNSGDVFVQVGQGQLQGSGGAGLGISIARQLAALHHGSEVELTSDGPGCGVRFVLRVCCADDALCAEETGSAPHAAEESTRSASACGSAATAGSAGHENAHARMEAPGAAAAASAAVGAALIARGTRAAASPSEPCASVEEPPAEADPAVAIVHGLASCADPPRPAKQRSAGSPSPVKQRPADPPNPTRQRSADSPHASVEGLHVLHVEDDHLLHRMLRLRLRKALGDFPITHVPDGKQAVELITEQGMHFDTVIMDNQMPVMTGTQATRELREAGFGGLIVGVTGDPEGCEDRNEFNTCGTDVVFDKDSAAIAAILALIANQAAELRRSSQ